MLIRAIAAFLMATSSLSSFGMEQESLINKAEHEGEKAKDPANYDFEYYLSTLENISVGTVVQLANGAFFYRPDIELAKARTKKPRNLRLNGNKFIPWQTCAMNAVLAETCLRDLIKTGLKPHVNPNFLSHRSEIEKVRSLAVCDLFNATMHKKKPDLLFFLSVTYLDRVLSTDLNLSSLRSTNNGLGNLTILCWILAWKIDGVDDDPVLENETHTPAAKLIPCTLRDYHELFPFESIIMNAINFSLPRVTAFEIFNTIMLRFDGLTDETKKLGECLLALTTVEENFSSISPTTLACSSIAIIRISAKKKKAWPNHLVKLTSLKKTKLYKPTLALRKIWKRANNFYDDEKTVFMRGYLEKYEMWIQIEPPSTSFVKRKMGKKKAKTHHKKKGEHKKRSQKASSKGY